MEYFKNFEKSLGILEYKFNKCFYFFEKKFFLTLIVLFFFSFIIRMYFTPFDYVLREDAYGYLLKSIEITKGNFIPVRTHPIGWPLFMSPFFYVFGKQSLFQNMVYARLISDVVGALAIFPLAYIGKKLLNTVSSIILLVIFVFVPPLVIISTSVLSEPLFILLLLLSICFVLKSEENQYFLILSSVIGAFAYYIRFNGIIILFIIILSYLSFKKQISNFSYKYMFFAIIIFFIISAPVLYQRYHYFGSPFDYGSLNKYFVDSKQEVWSDNIKAPSLVDYLKTHSLTQIIDKFIIHGLFGILYDYFFYVIPLLLLFFFLYGGIIKFNDRKFTLLYLALFIWIIGLIPIYHVMTVPRYLYPTIPIALIFIASALHEFFWNIKYKILSLTLFLIIFIIISLSSISQFKESQLNLNDADWAMWVAKNIKGKIAIMEGGDFIMMNLPDTAVGGNELHSLKALQSNLSITRPGYFKNLSLAMDWFKNIGVTHIAIDNHASRRPYLKKIYEGGEVPPYLVEIYSNYNTDSKWKMKIYYIDWFKYNKI